MSAAVAMALAALLVAALAVIVLYLTRTTPIERARWLDGEPQALEAGTDTFRDTVRVLAGTMIVPGHDLEVLANGDETYPRLWDDIGRARALVTWQVFWVKPGQLADRALDALSERARHGVRVLCLLDAFGSRGLPATFVERLRAAGAEVAVFRPLTWRNLYKVQQRMHVRTVVVDGCVAYTGGFGIDDRWLGDGRVAGSWRDTNLRLTGPSVDALQATFAVNWAEATGDLILGRTVYSTDRERPASDHRLAGVMQASPSLGSTTAERMFVLSILGARRRLYLTNAYFVPDASLRRLLCSAADRGVDVRVLTPGGNTDRRSAWLAARSHYEELLRGGVRLYEYGPSMIHAKTLVVDGCWSCIGTVNFDNRSMKLNEEVAVLMDDAEVASRLEAHFLDDLTRSHEILIEDVERRTLAARVAEHAARLVAPLL